MLFLAHYRIMRALWKLCFGYILLPLLSFSQRTYTNNSVLATGDWYKLSVNKAGIYKIDLPFLQKLGLRGSSFPSASIRVFGNSISMLPEACSGPVTDDLRENAILMVDGGDGVFSGNDYFLFYSPGPHQWKKDSVNHRFIHEKNLYT